MVGMGAFREWKTATKRRYNHNVAAVKVANCDGKTVLRAKLAGSFPGSPVMLESGFVLKHGKIVSLEID